MTITIALDAMGGDHGPRVTVAAALSFLESQPEARIALVGQPDVIESELRRLAAAPNERLRVVPATEVVRMDEPPAQALRTKRDSSMRVAVSLLRDGHADACVSAGNTGALMAVAHFILKTLPGIDRPAIVTALPTLNGHVHLLDLGANVECTGEHLRQFAVMGAIVATAVDGRERPSVGLLNVGVEDIKGNDVVKAAAQLLAHSGLNYIGYVEGDGIYAGHADVIVCDGFVGNIALKTSEGLARMIRAFLKEEFGRTMLTRLAGLVARPVLRAFARRVDPKRYNGATLVGLNGVVVKSHGGADTIAMRNALEVALREVRHNIPDRIRREMEPPSQRGLA
ncbi:phosphate acyltransferase PlsX [Acidiferrobacter sp.]|uniref:phosphate acyltransferase PlsX n=1 Tax=Acidiferrobacter sp. TaxID=1872107 RepID=UPI00261FD8B5|nr:phosphate acyltransferase PlsX [Acidiferrobacter sp.]